MRRGGRGSGWGHEAWEDENRYDSDNYADEYYTNEYYDDGYAEPPRRAGVLVRAGRVVSGVVCGAVLVLTVAVCVAQYLADGRGFPGPGTTSVASHVAGTVVAVAAQVTADRRRGASSLVASAVVIFTASILMLTQWWG
ncbi:hypothetical protein OED52_05955 [Rhodococcus sp. Z13]|uniref:Uncharacterized protein n=1 Tax=Rhodococcus sacchari TaxID=2962047 RepID=A0ACD4DJC9_9NOCA|nr:hypothetical protein [Rhodococcus sp. Z13]UYP20086.1 hypothetical protein OED52_05955 [Rhodococcus sp. Z13]